MTDGEPRREERGRLPPGAVGAVCLLLAVVLSLFQLWTAGVRPAGLFHQRALHLALIQLLAFLLFPTPGRNGRTECEGGGRSGPAGRRGRTRPRVPSWTPGRAAAWVLDGTLMAGSVLAAAYLTGRLDVIVDRAGAWTGTDIAVGVVAVVTLLEASRRVLGWGITLVGVGAVAYAYAGPFLPGLLRHGGYSTGRLVGQLYLGQEGIYGIPLGVAATFVFIFILFGGLLEATGAGRFFIDLAYAVTGRQRGGPAKAAVLASATLGSVSGSAIANVVTSGAFTIPLMKKVGYRGEEAGGVEAAASTGGQVLPPVMGAGAFLIAEYTGLPYLQVVRASIIPALLYLGTVFLFVHLTAVRRGMRGLSATDLPALGSTLAAGWHYLLAVGVLVGALLLDLSVTRVGFLACVAVALLAAARGVWDRIRSRRGGRGAAAPPRSSAGAWLAGGVRTLRDAFVLAARNALGVSLACAVAGIIVGVVGLTGLGLRFSALMLSLSGGSLPLALLLVIIASLVLGMGLPVTASYVVLIVLAGPVLVNEFGLPLLVAHLVVFWYSQDSNVTPPVCLAAFAAAGIARSDPMRTGFHAWKYAKGLYLIPLLMVAHPELALEGPSALLPLKLLVAAASLAAFAGALEGFLVGPLRGWERVLLVVGGAAAFHPDLRAALAAVVLPAAVLMAARLRPVQGQLPPPSPE